MQENSPNIDYKVLMANAVRQLENLQIKLNTLEQQKKEPIAIIGMGCRFPGGVNSPRDFWHLLENGIDGITRVPKNRWDIEQYYEANAVAAGKINTSDGGFVDEVDAFDAEFFRISPREAESLDPQQRFLLEVSWEALESANLVPQNLFNSLTGVFTGISTSDYSQLLAGSEEINAYFGTGNAFSAASGRVSYTMGFTGPCFSVDTACSSSLVAVHLACMSLRQRECHLALAGGVNLMLAPNVSITFSQAGMLAPDGRCKTFDAAANGYVRGEGCGVIVLKRLSDAIADGNNILALIRGSAINQDGPSGGLTVPNGPSQEAVIRQALANGGVDPEMVSYIEAHGTGTSLGDPIEVVALDAVFGKHHSQKDPLIVGSAKTNIGHLEAAAGIAGLIKVVLQLQHQKIAPHLHFQKPNIHINWQDIPIIIPTQAMNWQVNGKNRVAGLSSFGFSGTNSHIVLEEAPIPQVKSKQILSRPRHILTLSAKNQASLLELTNRYQLYLQNHPELAIADICHTANTGRTHFEHRLAIVAANHQELITKINNIQDRQEVEGVSQHLSPNNPPKVAFLFTGQGSQYINMGRQLYETQPVFRQALEQCDKILSDYLEHSLLKILYPETETSELTQQINQTTYTQPALFAIEYALAQVWQSWGIKPGVVIGHSVGEYIAACIAGVFSLEDGLRLIAARGKLMQQLPSGGEMVAVMAAAADVESLIPPEYADRVSLAAFNGPQSVVISGDGAAIAHICHTLAEQGIKTKNLEVSHAFHSPLMTPMLADFAKILQQVTYHRPHCPIISNVTGVAATDEIRTPEYWVNHVRQPVRFAQGITTLDELGYDTFLEIGPKPILLGMARHCISEDRRVWLPSLRPGHLDWQRMLQSLGQLYVQGIAVNWLNFDRDYACNQILLPTYPFEKKRYWNQAVKVSSSRHSKLKDQPKGHPLLGQKLNLPASKEIRFESRITKDTPAYLDQHRIYGSVVFLGAGYLEMALAAGVNIFKTEYLTLEDVNFITALILPESHEETTLHLVCNLVGEGQATWQIFSFLAENADKPESWVLHADGKISSNSPEPPQKVAISDVLERVAHEATQDFYTQMLDFAYGPLLRNMEQVWQHEGETLSKIKLKPEAALELGEYIVHPALLDTCFQTMFTLFNHIEVSYETPYVPIGCKTLKINCRPNAQVWSHARLNPATNSQTQNYTADVYLYSLDGELMVSVEGLQAKKISSQALFAHKKSSISNLLYEVEWRRKGLLGKLPAPDFLLNPIEISQKLNPVLPELVTQVDDNLTFGMARNLEALSVDYIVQGFLSMGWSYQPGETFDSDVAAQRLGVVPSQRQLFKRMLQILAEVSILEFSQQQWQVQQTLAKVNPTEKVQSLLRQDPEEAAALTLLNRCGSQLGGVLRGVIDPVQLIFPQGDLTTATQLYENSSVAKVMNTIVQQAITLATEKIPSSRGIRLLEIGAGTGGTTSYILPRLDPNQAEYLFTDIGALFTGKAKEKFRDYKFLRYQTLDIEVDPESQGFNSHQYDIIIAANVLHATTILEKTLSHVKQLLAPGGILVLYEITTPTRWADLVFGLLDGWWKFQDHELRPDYPLLSRSQWKKLLGKTGFTQVVTLPEMEGMPRILSEQAVVVAQAPQTSYSPTPIPKGWLLLADEQGVAQQLARELNSLGDVCTLVFAGEKYQQIAPGEFTINPNNPAEYEQIIGTIATQLPALHGVVQCWSIEAGIGQNIDSDSLENLSKLGCGTTINLVQALAKGGLSQPPQLWLVTSGSQPVPIDHPTIPGVIQSPLWGIGKSIALEHPEFKCVRIDLDPEQKSQEQAISLCAEILAVDAEDEIAYRQENRYVARLVRNRTAIEPSNQLLSLRSDATYLVTGGLGTLGLLVAPWLVERGAKHLVLVGRSSPSDSAKNKLAELTAMGVNVVLAQADVTQFGAIAKVIEDIQPPLAGVIHAAGILEDATIQKLTWSGLTKVMYPKLQGAWHLHQLTKNKPLDFFVLFSSLTSLLGSAGQANYSAANAFLDGLAHYRKGLGLPGLSINLAAFSQVGMLAQEQIDTLAQKKGIGTITPEQVLQVLDLLMSNNSTQVGVVPIDWSTDLASYSRLPLFADWIGTSQSSTQPEFLLLLQKANPGERREMLLNHVQQQVALVLGLNLSERIGLEKGFFDLGMDSLTSVELRNRLQASLGCSIPATGVFDYPTIIEMVNYLANEVLDLDFSEPADQNSQTAEPSSEDLSDLTDDEIAVLLAGELN